VLFARLLARLVSLLWLLALAAIALGVAAYCLDGLVGLGSARPDRLLSLPDVRRHVGRFLDQLGAHGPVATLSLLCGVGAVVAGLILLVGLVGPRKRAVSLEDNSTNGTLSAREGPMRGMLHTLANQPREAEVAKRPKLSLGYRHRHRPRVTVRGEYFAADDDPEEAQQAIEHALQPLTAPFGLTVRVHLAAERAQRRVR